MTRRHGHTSWGMGSDRADGWLEQAACKGTGNPVDDPMWPVGDRAQLICRTCTVRRECLLDGIALGEWEGIRAGYIGRMRHRHYTDHGLRLHEWPPPKLPQTTCQTCGVSRSLDPKHPYQKVCNGCRSKAQTDRRARERELAHVA